MAEERTLGLARAREASEADTEEPSKAALQRRMDEARDSISNTVTEIKENVTQQYESVKDALDWREHFKRQPVVWSLGAAGVGFLVGYGIASAITEDDGDRKENFGTANIYPPNLHSSTFANPPQPAVGEPLATAMSTKANGRNAADDGPGLLERFKETSAYDRLSKEAGSLGDRLVEELSTTAQQVVLPALLKKIKTWIGVDLSPKAPSMGTSQSSAQRSYEPSLGRSSEF